MTIQSTELNGFSLTVLTILTLSLYSPALGGIFNYDDMANLEPLEQVKDLSSALSFIFTGGSGPLGRPIALATFAAQATAWPNNPGAFIFVNILIHLANGLMISLVGWQLCQTQARLKRVALPFATSLCALWLLQPLLASASLMIIQRMTTLCTGFMLLGLIGYLAGRQRILKYARGGWLLMVGSLSLFGLLAIFTKETGALLPIFVWVLEYSILPAPDEHLLLLWWRRLLGCPLLLLLGYMLIQLPTIFELSTRGFSAWQRLLTEGPILWHYLYMLLLPRASELGPFHDDWFAVQSAHQSPEVALAWLAWIVAATLAVLGRKCWPWLSLAIGWFLLGHTLESSVFNLELYFEHRNYLPSVGILLALNAGFWQAPYQYKRAAWGIMFIYLGLLSFVLYQVTAAWGNPDVAARLWAQKHPDSERAQQFLINRMLARGDTAGALQAISETYARHPKHTVYGLQKIQLLCQTGQNVYQPIQDIIPEIINANIEHSMAVTIEKLLTLSDSAKCSGLNDENMLKLTDALLQNRFVNNWPSTQFRLHHLKARLFFHTHLLDPMMQELETAFNILPNLDTGILMVGVLASAGLHDQAREKLEEIRGFLPKNPIMRIQWLHRLSEIEDDLNQNPGSVTITAP